MDMGHTTIKEVVSDDATPTPMAPPTTYFLAATTSYAEVLAGYEQIIWKLSESRCRVDDQRKSNATLMAPLSS
jgi:hypothetical protein